MTKGNPYFGATFAERKAARLGVPLLTEPTERKQVDPQVEDVEDKAVKTAPTKRRAAAKKPS